jgi:hypothetical protein
VICRINPLAIESESIFLGYHTLANDWQDGVLTAMLRKANRVNVFDRNVFSENNFDLTELSYKLDLF